MDIQEFLLARIAEDEMDAVMACRHLVEVGRGDQWHYKAGKMVDPFGDEIRDRVGAVAKVMRGGAHMARHDPARVLRECEAKRELVDTWHDEHGGGHVLKTLAAVYADHPEYQQKWSL